MLLNLLERSADTLPSWIFIGIYLGVYSKKNKTDFYKKIKKIEWSFLYFFFTSLLIGWLSIHMDKMQLLNWLGLSLAMLCSALFAFYLASLRNTEILLRSYLAFFILTAFIFYIT